MSRIKTSRLVVVFLPCLLARVELFVSIARLVLFVAGLRKWRVGFPGDRGAWGLGPLL